MRLTAQSTLYLTTALFTSVIVAGCGNKAETPDAKKTATQVAAKVNSTEITVSQISAVLARTGNVPPEAAERAKREILEKLIEAELAKQEAVGRKLDRTPAVVQAIENSKTEILARAYLEQFAASQPKPTTAEVKKYFEEHPELFSQRRLYNFEEIAIPGGKDIADKLRSQISKSKNLQDVGNWLKAQDVNFTASRGARSAEQLPLALLPQVQSMKDGEMRVIESPSGLQVLRLVASQSAPVDDNKAAPAIQQFLFNRALQEAMATDMKQLKAKAKIEYVGDFAASAADAEAKAKRIAEEKAKAATDAKVKAEAESHARAEEISKARQAAEAAAKADAESRAKDEEKARARREQDAKSRAEADAKKSTKPAQPAPDVEKGVSGLLR